ncbi:DUF2290 domain-containing protein [Pseudomonas japonica]|uniref:DUF2290 domain-containing protein n=1 Tax=Pseudomonas japonica TaxID=256466 RepID=UPI0015E43BB6|nr:DUF2290 domain-containing protein [Pseudomonas japonica]MBA1289192.1 DUF2290 domain-containing protein [Pseudomonas japonica]
MTRQEVANGIMKTFGVVEKLQLLESFSQPEPLPVNEDFRKIILSEGNTYRDVYLAALNMSYHNIILSDFSFFQFSIEKQDHVRYAYYPNPFMSGSLEEKKRFRKYRELLEAELISQEDFERMLVDTSHVSGVPMFRYENAPGQRVKFHHPCSHFHIGFHSENRWPVERILTPFAFSLLVLKQYHGISWRSHGDSEDDAHTGNIFDTNLISEKYECRIIGPDFFEDIEKRSFFFG